MNTPGWGSEADDIKTDFLRQPEPAYYYLVGMVLVVTICFIFALVAEVYMFFNR